MFSGGHWPTNHQQLRIGLRLFNIAPMCTRLSFLMSRGLRPPRHPDPKGRTYSACGRATHCRRSGTFWRRRSSTRSLTANCSRSMSRIVLSKAFRQRILFRHKGQALRDTRWDCPPSAAIQLQGADPGAAPPAHPSRSNAWSPIRQRQPRADRVPILRQRHQGPLVGGSALSTMAGGADPGLPAALRTRGRNLKLGEGLAIGRVRSIWPKFRASQGDPARCCRITEYMWKCLHRSGFRAGIKRPAQCRSSRTARPAGTLLCARRSTPLF